MNPEDRLRDAARSYTDPIRPAPDAWTRVRERVDAEPRRRRVPAGRVALAGFATAIVIALVVTLVTVVRDEGDNGSDLAVGSGAADSPAEIIAVTEDGRVVALDSATGEELRLLADGADAQTTIAVTPDGERIFFDRASSTREAPIRETVTVPSSGGEVQRLLGEAGQPAVSPDGKLLANVSYAGPAGGTEPQSLVVHEIASLMGSGPARVVGAGTVGEVGERLSGLSWAPDSQHLAFVFFDPEGGGISYLRVVDTETATTISDARDVPFDERMGVYGYLGLTGDFFGPYSPPQGPPRVVSFSSDTGEVLKDLFPIPDALSSPGEFGVFDADTSGRHVLLVADGALYRQSVGEAEPTKLANGIAAAKWMPTPQPSLPEPEPAPDTDPGPESVPAPARLVAAKSDGRLVVMDAATGAEIRTLADELGAGTTIAVTPDGKRVFFDRPSGPESDPPVEIATVLTSGGEVDRLIGGAGQPAVSPDGRLLAFVRYRPAGLQVVEIPDTFEGWIPNIVGDGEVSGTSQVVIAPSWAPDSRHLVYTVVTTPEGSPPRVAELAYGMRLDAAPPIPVPLASCAVTSYLGDTGLVSVAHGGDRAIAVDPASGQEVRELFRGPGLGCGADRPLASDPSGTHLLYVTSGAAPALYRWSEGDADPTRVADGIVAAAWLTPPT